MTWPNQRRQPLKTLSCTTPQPKLQVLSFSIWKLKILRWRRLWLGYLRAVPEKITLTLLLLLVTYATVHLCF